MCLFLSVTLLFNSSIFLQVASRSTGYIIAIKDYIRSIFVRMLICEDFVAISFRIDSAYPFDYSNMKLLTCVISPGWLPLLATLLLEVVMRNAHPHPLLRPKLGSL